jgi:hypothetical protein
MATSLCNIADDDHGAHVDAAWLAHLKAKHDAHYQAFYLHRHALQRQRKVARVIAGEIDW